MTKIVELDVFSHHTMVLGPHTKVAGLDAFAVLMVAGIDVFS
jgi:hypothetical protein